MKTALRLSTRYNLVAIPALALIGFIWIYPFLWSLSAAFKTELGVFTSGAGLIPRPFEFGNFSRAWVQAGFGEYFLNTVIYSVASTAIEVIKSALCGYVLARYRFPGRNLLYRLVVATLFVPVASIIIPQFTLISNLGLLNSRAGVVLALSGAAGALYVLFFTSFFQGIPEELFEAAKLEGASFVRTFLLVLPLARPVIAVVVIFQFLASWNDFNIPLILTLSQPHLRNLAVGMFAFQGANSTDWTGFAAGTVMAFVPVLVVFLVFQRDFVKGLAGAVKE
jgi:raffinose/stachyose/melibiose transport system permease protein